MRIGITRRAKHARDEAWSFIHRQVLKVWWLLMSVGVLLTFATFFYGGGYMTFAAWVVLVGLGLYMHGLFSEELLEWIGALIIATGIAMPTLRLDYATTQWIAASILVLGLPLLAAMLDRGRQRAAWVRLVQSSIWLLCVLIPPMLAQRFASDIVPPDAPVVALENFRKQSATQQIVTLPVGSTIPVKVEISGNLFRASDETLFPLVLNQPLEVMMSNGQLTGDWRIPGESWAKAQETLSVNIPWIKVELTPQNGAEIRTGLSVKIPDPATR